MTESSPSTTTLLLVLFPQKNNFVTLLKLIKILQRILAHLRVAAPLLCRQLAISLSCPNERGRHAPDGFNKNHSGPEQLYNPIAQIVTIRLLSESATTPLRYVAERDDELARELCPICEKSDIDCVVFCFRFCTTTTATMTTTATNRRPHTTPMITIRLSLSPSEPVGDSEPATQMFEHEWCDM